MVYKTHCPDKKQVVISAQHIIYINTCNLYFFLTCIFVDFEKSVNQTEASIAYREGERIRIAYMSKRLWSYLKHLNFFFHGGCAMCCLYKSKLIFQKC